MAPYNDDREITYEIVEEIGVLAEQPTGWKKELNVVSWNGGQAKYDIREWSPNHTQMGRGLTLNEREMRTIIDLLKRRARYVPRRSYSARGESEAPVRVADDSAAHYQAEKDQETRADHEAAAGHEKMVYSADAEDYESAEEVEVAEDLETEDDLEDPEEFEETVDLETEETQAATA